MPSSPRSSAPKRPDPEPLEVDAVPVVSIGTLLWAVAFAVLLPFQDSLARHHAGWWLWTCAAGVGLGLLGLWVVTRRRARLRVTAAAPDAVDRPAAPVADPS